MPDPLVPPRQIVTASDLVRHFGYWQDRAAVTPLYILRRGRPRLVLTSVELMDALCAPHAAYQSGCSPDLAAVLDWIEDRVLVADADQRIVAASITARNTFGTLAEPGAALGALVADTSQPRFTATIARVLRTGVAAAIDLPTRLNSGHLFSLLIDIWPGGLLLVARDAADPRADAAALESAIAATGSAAAARIDTRGDLEATSRALAALCGRPADALTGTAFVALFEPTSQQTVADALGGVITSEYSLQTNAMLLVDGSAARAVRIGFAPRRLGMRLSGVTALLLAP